MLDALLSTVRLCGVVGILALVALFHSRTARFVRWGGP